MYYAGWQLIAEYDGAGMLQRKYVYGPGIDEPVRMSTGATTHYFHSDGHGSVTEITGSTGQLVETPLRRVRDSDLSRFILHPSKFILDLESPPLHRPRSA